jgi:hypothetical protein
MAGFKQLYSGSDYYIHFKYSNILNVVYITCIYGVGMPLLFPVAVINFFNQYICERIIVAYGMKLPPGFDDKLTQNAIEMLKYAPLMMLFNSYWMISNLQIFDNKWTPIDNNDHEMKSGHVFHFSGVDWASPNLLMCIASVFLIVISKLF